jgi:hypothetical protein
MSSCNKELRKTGIIGLMKRKENRYNRVVKDKGNKGNNMNLLIE